MGALPNGEVSNLVDRSGDLERTVITPAATVNGLHHTTGRRPPVNARGAIHEEVAFGVMMRAACPPPRKDRILNPQLAETLSVALLVLVLACAVIRPFGWPEAVVAVPAAALVIATGALSFDDALAEAERLGPVIGFLAAVLVLAQLCDDEGLFQACGAWMGRTAAGRPRRLLVQVFLAASVITAVLSLDATVVLLTPVVFATAARIGARPKPHVYACTHLSNTASLLLPVSNLTNLLAFTASGLSFTRFAALMALPWAAAIGVEYLVFRRFFATDLDAGAQAPAAVEPPPLPLFALVTVGCTLVGFVLTSAVGIDPAWAALAGALALAVRALIRRRTTPWRWSAPPPCPSSPSSWPSGSWSWRWWTTVSTTRWDT